jgi:fatty acid desaturase
MQLQIGKTLITDPVFVAGKNYNAFERFFLKYLNDERDLPFVKLTFTVAAIFFPVAIFLYLPGMFNWYVAAAYLVVNWAIFLGPFILMLHLTSHRSLFKKEYKFLNNTIPWIVGPFFGETPETYFVHHVTMHHLENNLKNDLSSTLHYRRDNFLHFLAYFFEFFFAGIFQLSWYQIKHKRYKYLKNLLAGEIMFYALCVGLSFVNWQATLVVFIIPFIFTRFMMMAGNWGQHAFVDRNDPGNSYKNSITCINTSYNKKCFNDGYHIGHHLRPNMHWTKYPEEFVENKDKYIAEDSIVFRGIDFFEVWALLMMHNYKALAARYVQLDENNPKSTDEIIALLKERVRWN